MYIHIVIAAIALTIVFAALFIAYHVGYNHGSRDECKCWHQRYKVYNRISDTSLAIIDKQVQYFRDTIAGWDKT